MQIATYNLNGIRSALNKGWMNWMQETSFDVVCIQELKAQNEQIDLEAFAQAGYHVYTETAEKKGYSGVAIFSKQKPDHVEYGCGNQEFDKEGRVIRADYGDLSVFSIYFPSGTTGDVRQSVKYVFLDYIYEYLMTLQKTRKKLVVCGDYNIAHREIDIHDPRGNKNSSGFLPEERAWMDKWFGSGYTDSLRVFSDAPHQYTWWSFRANARANNKGWRIDYISVTDNLKDKLRSATILPDALHSDHCPMVIELDT
ncbi:MAG: exodeoxyribonuclease III [Chitinophagales bacterium]|nr:exodeoxyribonuclease III [Chitinophagales bacterium]MCB9021063.1 exodeoxyribonuclease III [Chitinophagales bacterium]HAE13860.1 exodeoxyribonuclease III [Bacteroidota bacterium]HAE35175.1 exodeoxyribonuclease III [Bacteroidota bacterium]